MKSPASLALAQIRLRAKYASPRRSRGRPPLEIDPVSVYWLARDGCSTRDIAASLRCDPGTIRRRFGALLEYARLYRARWDWLDGDPMLRSLEGQKERQR